MLKDARWFGRHSYRVLRWWAILQRGSTKVEAVKGNVLLFCRNWAIFLRFLRLPSDLAGGLRISRVLCGFCGLRPPKTVRKWPMFSNRLELLAGNISHFVLATHFSFHIT